MLVVLYDIYRDGYPRREYVLRQRTQPQFPTTHVNAVVKSKVLLPDPMLLERRRDTNVRAMVLLVDIIVVIVIVITTMGIPVAPVVHPRTYSRQELIYNCKKATGDLTKYGGKE